jgi:hypothetical protein
LVTSTYKVPTHSRMPRAKAWKPTTTLLENTWEANWAAGADE